MFGLGKKKMAAIEAPQPGVALETLDAGRTAALKKLTHSAIKSPAVEDEVRTIGIQAKELLGYGRIDNTLRLEDALVKLQIEVLTGVDEYMTEVSKRVRELWKWTRIANYQDPIPEFVLRRAIQIKQEAPDINFHIVHLGPQLDSFLFAGLDGRGCYIEMWDKPEFEHPLLRSE